MRIQFHPHPIYSLFLLLHLVSSTITSIPSVGIPPIISEQSSLSSINDNLYTFGGRDSSGSFTNTIHEFSMSKHQWTSLQSSSQFLPCPRMSSVLVGYLGDLYVFGGQDSDGIQEELWRYKISTGSWVQIPLTYTFVVGRSYTAYVLSGNLLYLFGGITIAGPDSTVIE